MTVWKYIIGGALAISSLVTLILISLRLLKKRGGKVKGEEIENAIDKKNPILILLKNIKQFEREEKLQHAVIYYFQILRIISKKQYNVRNAQTLPVDRLLSSLRGTNLSINDLALIDNVYTNARFNNLSPTNDEYLKYKLILQPIINKIET